MKQINTLEEFRKFYPYKSPPNKDKCPKRYPCFCEIIDEDGGIGGSYMWVAIVYPPKNVDLRSFKLGLKAGRES